MENLKEKLNELRSLERDPEIFLKNYFKNIRNQITNECETFLIEKCESSEERENAISQREEMIKETENFELRCRCANLGRGQYSQDIDSLQNKLKNINIRDDREVSEAEGDFESAIYSRKKNLLMHKGVVFFEMTEKSPLALFGALIQVEDEYVPFLKFKLVIFDTILP